MSTILRRLALSENGALAGRAFCEFRNYVLTGLMSETAITNRIVASTRGSTMTEIEALTAVHLGIAAAEGKHS